MELQLPYEDKIIIFPKFEPYTEMIMPTDPLEPTLEALLSDPSTNQIDVEVFWANRWNLSAYPDALPQLLHATDWKNHQQVLEIYQ